MIENKEKSMVQEYRLSGLTCADCALRVEDSVSRVAGVKLAQVDFMTSRLRIEAQTELPDFRKIEKAVKDAGYSIESKSGPRRDIFKLNSRIPPREVKALNRKLTQEEGIIRLKLHKNGMELVIEHELKIHQVTDVLDSIGVAAAYSGRADTSHDSSSRKTNLRLVFTLISGALAATGITLKYLGIDNYWTVSLFIFAILVGGYPVGLKGLQEARHFRLGMNFLMSVAVVGAAAIGEWSEAAMVIFLFSLAEWLESFSIQRARNSLASVLNLTPPAALCKTGEGIIEKPVEQVTVGEVIVIKPGSRIPLDGQVIAGMSSIDQSPITGESIPQQKSVGDEVFAGSLNQHGMIEVQVSRPSEDSTLARIIHLVEVAQSKRAPLQNFVNQFARYYTPAVVLLAIGFATIPPLLFSQAFSEWFYRALVLLVISCPCALVISTPITLVSALTNASRNGIVVKGGAFLENFHKLKCLAFDKTGTLTYGRPVVQQVISLNSYKEIEILQMAASIEANSEHIISRAILDYAREKNIVSQGVNKFTTIPGRGASAVLDGKQIFIGNHKLFEENGWCQEEVHQHLENFENQRFTTVLIGNAEQMYGMIALSDEVRQEAEMAVRDLANLGVERIVMVTGDNETTAEAIAINTGITQYHAELLPADKVTVIEQLKSREGLVGMVGDGINDAPALATADIGISMGITGSDTAIETADITLMQDDLNKLPYLKRLSHKTVRIIKQNIFIALFLKLVFFILAIPGFATLWMAVFADMGASLLVIFNGMRVLQFSKAPVDDGFRSARVA